MVIDTKRAVGQVAREIGVGEQLLGRWVAEPSIEFRRMGSRRRVLGSGLTVHRIAIETCVGGICSGGLRRNGAQ